MRVKINSQLSDLYKYKDEHREAITKALGSDFMDCELCYVILKTQDIGAQIAYAKWNQVRGAIKVLERVS